MTPYYAMTLTDHSHFSDMLSYCVVSTADCQLPWESMKDLTRFIADHQGAPGILSSQNPLGILVVGTMTVPERVCFEVAPTSLKGLSFHLRLRLVGSDLGLELTCPQDLLLVNDHNHKSKLEPICLYLGKIMGHKHQLVDRLVHAYN